MKPPLRRYHRCVRSRFWTSCVSAYATCITATNRTGLCPLFVPSSVSTVCVTRQPLGSSEVEAFRPGWRTSARFRSPRIVRHWRPCCSSTARCAVTDLPSPGDRKTRPSRCLPVVLTPDEVVRIPLVFWKASIVCSPSFCMERACGSVRVCNCGSRILISITADHRAGGQGLQGSGLDVTRELGTSLREQLSRARAWWLRRTRPRAAAALRFPTPLSGSIRAPGIPGRGSGFCAAHAFDRSTERCRASPSHV